MKELTELELDYNNAREMMFRVVVKGEIQHKDKTLAEYVRSSNAYYNTKYGRNQ